MSRFTITVKEKGSTSLNDYLLFLPITTYPLALSLPTSSIRPKTGMGWRGVGGESLKIMHKDNLKN
jgi:hypothetical protein